MFWGLYSKNIIDDPTYASDSNKDMKHFLMECNQYQKHRQEILRTVSEICNPMLNVLLYGNTTLSDDSSTLTFFAVQTFIFGLKCFQV